MVIYAEYLFLENFITGAIILVLTGKMIGVRIKKSLLALGSILCGAYSFILFWDSLAPWIIILSKLSFSVFLILIVFQTTKLRLFFRTVLIFYLISFAMGGITIGAMYFMKLSGVTHNSAIYLEGMTYLNIAVGCTLTYIIFINLASYIKGRLIREKTTADVIIELENKKVEMKGLVDTGNFLKDPLTGKPVLIISIAAAKKILPLEIVEITTNEENVQELYKKLMESDFANRIRFIPYKSIGEGKGMLIGVRPDKISIGIHEGKSKSKGKSNFVTMQEGVILAIYKGIFSSDNNEDSYSILLHPSAMEGGIACNV